MSREFAPVLIWFGTGIALLLLAALLADRLFFVAVFLAPPVLLCYVIAGLVLLLACVRRALKKRTKESWLAVAAIPLLLGVLVLMAPGIAFVAGPRHPSDARLLTRFSTHRADLELLIDMFQHDRGLGRVGKGFTRPEDPSAVGITAQRIAEYHRLCGNIGATNCIEGYDAAYETLYGTPHYFGKDKDPIWIHVSALGLSISGSGKGYIYSQHPAFPVVENLDDIKPARSGTWLRHIEGPWYLYYDYED